MGFRKSGNLCQYNSKIPQELELQGSYILPDLCNTNHLLHVVPMRIMRRFSPIKRCGRGCVKISSSCAASYFRHSLWYASCFAISSFLHGLKSVRKCMKMCHFWFESGIEWKKNYIFFSFPYANFFQKY